MSDTRNDALGPDAAALVAAAAPVIRDMVPHLTNWDVHERTAHAERIAAAALAPALRELAGQAQDDGNDFLGVAVWLRDLADALDARGVTP